MYLFLRAKKIVFCKYLFLQMAREISASRKKNKKKTVESRDIWLIFLSRSTERQAGHNGKTVAIDLF